MAHDMMPTTRLSSIPPKKPARLAAATAKITETKDDAAMKKYLHARMRGWHIDAAEIARDNGMKATLIGEAAAAGVYACLRNGDRERAFGTLLTYADEIWEAIGADRVYALHDKVNSAIKCGTTGDEADSIPASGVVARQDMEMEPESVGAISFQQIVDEATDEDVERELGLDPESYRPRSRRSIPKLFY